MTEKNPIISFFYYTDEDVSNKAKLFNILTELKEENVDNVVDLEELVQSGNFERVCRLLMPKTLTKFADYDTTKNETTVFFDLNREYIKNSTFNDTINFIEENDIHVISTHSDEEINKSDLINDLFNQRESDVVLEQISDLYTDSIIPPISEPQWFRETTGINNDDKLPHHYLITSRRTFDLVGQFEKKLKGIKGAVIPKNEGIKTYIYQMLFNGYRLTAAKVSKLSKPVIFTDRLENTEQFLNMIADSDLCVIEDWDKEMKIVDNDKVIRFIDQQSLMVGDTQLPVSDAMEDNGKIYRYLYTVGKGNSLENATEKHSFDVICSHQAVLDEKNHKIMSEVR